MQPKQASTTKSKNDPVAPKKPSGACKRRENTECCIGMGAPIRQRSGDSLQISSTANLQDRR